MDRMILRGEPTGPFQKISVIVNDKKVESLGVDYDDLLDVVFALVQKYDLKRIDLSGAKIYMQGIEHQIKEAGMALYSITDLEFCYV